MVNSRQLVVSTHATCSGRPYPLGVASATLSAWVVTLSVLATAPAYAQGPNAVLEWNLIASNAAVAGGQNSVVQTRTFAMVQAAVHDALNAIDRRYDLYVLQPGMVPIFASPEAAVATAAHDVLMALIPSQAGSLDAAYASALSSIADGPTKEAGAAVGAAAAAAILALRATDGAADANRAYTPGTEPGAYQPTTPNAPVVTPGWGDVAPFVLEDLARFDPPLPYSLENLRYTQDFAEVKLIGAAQSTDRSAEQTEIARFWAEAMATMWNRIARTVAQQRGLGLWESARLLGVMNFALADATIGVYAAKYAHNFWRPLTAIRNADVDGNPETDADPDWTSLLTASNHPEYPSAHSYQAAAAAQVLAATFGDDLPFSIGSLTLPNVTRTFDRFSQAAAEIGESRIYGGIHFRLAVEVGLTHGAVIGRLVERQGLRSSSLYQLVASHSQKCLDVPEWSVNDGIPVVQWTCNGGDNQTWRVEPVSEGYSRVIARHSGKCLDVSGASTDDGAAIIQWQCHGGENQQWRVEAVTGGFQLVARNSGKCLDVSGESTNDGQSIIQWSCHGGANQTWLLRPGSTVPPPVP